MIAFKLLRRRRDGSIGPLFINRRQRIPVGEWLTAEPHNTKGYAFRPGWHCMFAPLAPHLSMRGREWFVVLISDYETFMRPASQGGKWALAHRMKVLHTLESDGTASTTQRNPNSDKLGSCQTSSD